METDNQIITQIHAGKPQAFALLYEKYVDKIYAFIYYKTHHKQTAEDITSFTFTKALENIHQFKPHKGSFQAWLYQIARNNVNDFYRNHHFSKSIEDAWDIATTEDIERDVDLRNQLAEIKQGLQQLSSSQRDIVILRVWQNLSYAEIAAITGKSVNACKMDFSRATHSLRKEFQLAILLFFLLH